MHLGRWVVAQYFTWKTDEAIVAFQKSADPSVRNKIFFENIRPAFEKLIENLIFVYGFFKIGDVDVLKKECLTNLYEMIEKFDSKKGTKAFSYFNVIAKNWFIFKMRERNRNDRLESELFYDLDHEAIKNDPRFMQSPFEDIVEEKEFWRNLDSAMDEWKHTLKKGPERQVLDAIVFLMKNPELVSIYNKKAVYLYLREITGLTTKQVIVNLKKIKTLYSEWHDNFCATGET